MAEDQFQNKYDQAISSEGNSQVVGKKSYAKKLILFGGIILLLVLIFGYFLLSSGSQEQTIVPVTPVIVQDSPEVVVEVTPPDSFRG